MRSNSSFPTRGLARIFAFFAVGACIATTSHLFAVTGVFQGRVVEGTKREAGKYIYVAGRTGYLRRVNIQKCRVRFDSGVPAAERVHNPSDYLRDDAEIRVSANQSENGEWVALEIVILKLPVLDKARLLT